MGAIDTSGGGPAGVAWRSREDPRPRQGRPGRGPRFAERRSAVPPPPPPPATSRLHPGHPGPRTGREGAATRHPTAQGARARDARCQARAQRRGPARRRAGAGGRPAAAHRGSPRAAGSGRRPTAPLGHRRGAAAGGGRASPRAGPPNPGPPPTLPAAASGRGPATPQPHLFSFSARLILDKGRFAVQENPATMLLKTRQAAAQGGGRGRWRPAAAAPR